MVSGVFHSIKSDKIQCSFKKVEASYGCFATKLTVEFENKVYDSFIGRHQRNKQSGDVNYLSIRDSKANYIPSRLDSIFNLTALTVEGTSLLKIRSKDFRGLQKLKYINFGFNYLTDVPYNAFYKLSHLVYLVLVNNQLQELSNKVFKKNLKLEKIFLNNNHIKFIGQETFKNLKKLNLVELSSNKCLSGLYVGISSMEYLNKDIKVCENKIEAIPEKIHQLKKKIRNIREENRLLVEIIKEPCESKKKERYFSEISNVTIV